jgi:hypothetical protein
MTAEQKRATAEMLQGFAKREKQAREVAAARNELEAYIINTRSKLEDDEFIRRVRCDIAPESHANCCLLRQAMAHVCSAAHVTGRCSSDHILFRTIRQLARALHVRAAFGAVLHQMTMYDVDHTVVLDKGRAGCLSFIRVDPVAGGAILSTRSGDNRGGTRRVPQPVNRHGRLALHGRGGNSRR